MRPLSRWMVLSLAVVILVSPVALAFAGPALAQVGPPAVAPPPHHLLPVPNAGALPSLGGLFDSFPIVVRDLPDDASKVAVDQFDAAHLDQPDAMAGMYLLAWGGIWDALSPEDYPKVRQFAADLAAGIDLGDASAANALAADSQMVWPILLRDQRNADRLNNVAVALIGLSVALDASAEKPGIDVSKYQYADHANGNWQFGYFVSLDNSGLWLLDQIDQHFPANRAATLNRAYVASVAPATAKDAIGGAIPIAQGWLDANPSDRTARLLLGSLQSRQPESDDGLRQAVATLTPLTHSLDSAALGHAALGDAYLAAATLCRTEAPSRAADLARQALAQYDQSLAGTTDAGVYAGRAAALDLLGDIDDAVVSQRRAVERDPASAALQIRLASLLEEPGDFAGMRKAARAAYALTFGPNRETAPTFTGTRLTILEPQMVPGDRGFLGYSLGSDRPGTQFLANASQGGVFLVALDAVPRTGVTLGTATDDNWRLVGSPAQVARALAVTASILLGDAAGVQADAGRPADVLAASLVAGKPAPTAGDPKTATEALALAQNTLRHAGRFTDAVEVCRRAAAAPVSQGFDPLAATRCQGEAAYLAGDFAAASTTLQHAYELAGASKDDAVRSTADVLRLEAGGGALAANQREQANGLLTQAASAGGGQTISSDISVGEVVGLTRLGELDLIAGDPSRAVGHEDLALAALESPAFSLAVSDPATVEQGRALAARAHLNRGLARLWMLQSSPGTSPSCGGDHHADCVAARQDFTAALAVDPQDPNYLIDAAWADRLLGNDQGARQDLLAAVREDPAPFALNDLGVLQARAGDATGARQSFQRALASSPTYSTAAWNLGVLDLRSGLLGIPAGEALLARAIAHTPALRDHAVDYITDESVYRVTLRPGAGSQTVNTIDRGYALAALALGSLILIAAGGQALGTEVSSKGLDTVKALADAHLLKLVAAVRQHTGPIEKLLARVTVPGPTIPWLVTLPALVLVTTVPVLRAPSTAAGTLAVLTLLAAGVALAAREAGMMLATHWLGGRAERAPWNTGVALSVLFLPFQATAAPYLGHRITHESARRAWWIALAGPAANLLAALVAFGLSLWEPMPLLRLIALTQFAAIGFALVPKEPMEGAVLKERAIVFTLLGALVACVGLVVTRGSL